MRSDLTPWPSPEEHERLPYAFSEDAITSKGAITSIRCGPGCSFATFRR